MTSTTNASAPYFASVYGRTATHRAEEDGVRRTRIVTTEPIVRGETTAGGGA